MQLEDNVTAPLDSIEDLLLQIPRLSCLHIEILVDTVTRAFTPEPGLLHAAKGAASMPNILMTDSAHYCASRYLNCEMTSVNF